MPFLKIEEIPQKTLLPGFIGRFFHSEKITVAHFEIAAASILPLHSHEHEQISQVIKGKFELTIEGESQILENGMAAVIPSNVKHSGVAITDCYVIDIFSPIREDYKAL
jgi:quercetin dioxygenase-like cupin family protein